MNPKLTCAAGAALVTLTACQTAVIDPGDATPPTVEIKVRQDDGSYVAKTAVDLAAEPIELMAVGADDDGLRRVTLEFLNRVSDSCTVSDGGGSSGYDGAFTVPLPENQSQDVGDTEKQETLTSMPLLATVPAGPTCSVGTAKGRPIGHTFTVKATATNWGEGSQPVVATLLVTIR